MYPQLPIADVLTASLNTAASASASASCKGVKKRMTYVHVHAWLLFQLIAIRVYWVRSCTVCQCARNHFHPPPFLPLCRKNSRDKINACFAHSHSLTKIINWCWNSSTWIGCSLMTPIDLFTLLSSLSFHLPSLLFFTFAPSFLLFLVHLDLTYPLNTTIALFVYLFVSLCLNLGWAKTNTGMSIYFLYGIRNSNEAIKVIKDASSPSIQCHSEMLNGFVKCSSSLPPASASTANYAENSNCLYDPSHVKMIEVKEMNTLNSHTSHEDDGKS